MATPQVSTTRILRRLLASGVNDRAERLLARIHPADLGPLLADLGPDEIRRVIDLLFRQHRAASTLRQLPPELLPQIFEAVDDARLAEVLGRLDGLDDLFELLEWLPEERRPEVKRLLPESRQQELRHIEMYPESSAGRVMTTRFVALHEEMSAQEAIDRIRSAGGESDAILYLYVVDEKGTLRGVVPIRRLVAAPPSRPVQELMIASPISVRADADQEEAARLVAHYDLLALPVTDPEGRMLGVITVDDVIDVITEEATEDMYHLAGLHEEDRVFVSAGQSVRKRLPWMLTNLATAFLAAWVIGLFELTLERIVALAIFMPVVAMLAGNGGIQSLTVITRSIALGEIEFSSGLRAAGRELGVGLVLGTVVGMLAGGLVYAWRGNTALALALSLALVLNMALAGLLGAAVPLGLKALRLDPALGSGVVVTAFTDIFGFFSFLAIGTLLAEQLA
jgi:magnesium transporter